MAKKDINEKPFDEGTLTKLELFQRYTREWLPVFVARDEIIWPQVHTFDFFCGSGSDSEGVPGSAIRILEEVRAQQDYVDRASVSVTVHLYDVDGKKVDRLCEEVNRRGLELPNVRLDIQPGEFADKFREALPTLKASDTACLVILDQYGIKDVTQDVFQTLVDCPTTDVLFFISSSILHRLNDHPNIAKYLNLERSEDSHDAHRAVADHYRSMVSQGKNYYVAPFSIKKGSNVYGVIFGTAHPKGMEKFLRVAWKEDSFNGEANFDINREGFTQDQPTLDFDEFRPTKLTVFEADLRSAILNGTIRTEADIYGFCINAGMIPSHAKPVISTLKSEGRIECSWTVPHIDSLKASRPLTIFE